MELKPIYDFFNILEKDNLSIIYHGYFSDDFTDKIININEINIEKNEIVTSLKSKVSFLVAECFQNIVRHVDLHDNQIETNQEEDYSGIFIIRNIENTYYISSANTISNENINSLEEKLKQINQLNKEELKILYLDLLNHTGLSEKGGAGLGLIEMAKKSGQKLEYSFENIDEISSYFYFQLKLSSKNTGVSENDISKISINSSKELHSMMDKNNIFLTYKGDFNQSTILPILKIIEQNLNANKNELNKTKRSVYQILIELLQNVIKHSVVIDNKKNGIFLIGKNSQKYIISTGNFIENKEVENLVELINKLNDSNENELKIMYINKLKTGEITENGCAGLGLIDIARQTREKIIIDFLKINNHYSFLTITINT